VTTPFVLVADDDRDTRELYRAFFDISGYRTAEAMTGSEAIASALQMAPDVLLADYVLPDVDGIAIARRLKADSRTASVRILMITGYATPDVERRATAAGIDAVLFKPALPQTVMREVARTLSRHQYRKGRRPFSPGASSGFAATADTDADGAARRVREEFAALPGLSLTAEQARLVFGLPRHEADRILQGLIAEGFLARTPLGAYRRPR
jgi:CheY-like chemotaxis protein